MLDFLKALFNKFHAHRFLFTLHVFMVRLAALLAGFFHVGTTVVPDRMEESKEYKASWYFHSLADSVVDPPDIYLNFSSFLLTAATVSFTVVNSFESLISRDSERNFLVLN